MIPNCNAKSIIAEEHKIIVCTLPAGHGGVHAARIEKERTEVSTVGTEIRRDYPTVVYETTHTWATGQFAVVHKAAR